ncbi:MAG: RNA pseudouridine synthase [Alphaproteobacteria bacterium RIFOXYD12_FULL_60_8]|nr:MAG: RNA pseudouridine synthase [Alphaproteobacteria bacterium RIFOXYD12_FULL_60_8]
MSLVENVAIGSDEGELRLDRWFKRHYPDLSFIQLQKLLRTGQVRVDGKRAKAGDRVHPGQIIRVPPLPAPPAGDRPKPAKPTQVSPEDASALKAMILHMDDQVIVLNKPPGLAVQGGTGATRHVDGMLDALKFDKPERPRLVHRLDKDTSGVLLLARTAQAATLLTKAFKGRDVRKVYWALVIGVPQLSEGTIKAPLAKLPGRMGEKMVVDEERGDVAITDFSVIEAVQKKLAWLELEPHTGRTHQLRVHCLVLGTPILGDGKYGGAEAFLEGFLSRKMHLHARSLTFPHPAGGSLTITAPLPEHMKKTFEFFGMDANR